MQQYGLQPLRRIVAQVERVVAVPEWSRTGQRDEGQRGATADVDRAPEDSSVSVPDSGAASIMTPAERIVLIVKQNGGIMKQSEIVQSVEWSESTVSRRLSELESTGALARYQIGRGKVVYLPGAEPAAMQSPLATGLD